MTLPARSTFILNGAPGGKPASVLRMGEDGQAADKWLLHSWQPTADYVAAVAVQLATPV